jgi:hypothetical protein
MDLMNELPKMTDQEVVNHVCQLRPSSPPGSLGANLDITPARYSQLRTAEQELTDRGYTESSPGCWEYEGDARRQLTCEP